jgi:2-keto-4-pentenoate hydratase/2-oxohepta-3-ene-1,7-dioic acid hydratase in catechol pathway
VEEASQYILGYTIGNDLTARLFQDPKKSGGQYSFAKSFDSFAPLGPVIVNSEHFGSWGEKTLKTTVNGRIVQESPLDLIWGPAELVSFLSQGTVIQDRSAVLRK